MDHRRQKLARIVALAAAAFPALGMISFAFFSVLFGEARFQNSGGLTGAGATLVALPLVVAGGCFVWLRSGRALPTGTTVNRVIAGFAAACVGVGLIGLTASEERPVFGGLLLATGIVAFAVRRLRELPVD